MAKNLLSRMRILGLFLILPFILGADGCDGTTGSGSASISDFTLSNLSAVCESWNYSGSKYTVTGKIKNSGKVGAGVELEINTYSSSGGLLLTDTFNYPFLAGSTKSSDGYIAAGSTRTFSEVVTSFNDYNTICAPFKSWELNVVNVILPPEDDDDDDD